MGVSGLAVRDTGLIGRDSEVSLLRGLVDPPSGESRVLVLLGDAGMGKTALLADAARQARSTGMWVLSVTGREPEQYLAFAGLRQLLLPVLDRVADLPDRQTLLEALALSTATVQPDALLTGIAVLTVLSELAEDHPLLVVADNAQWLDRGSLDTLAFAARRLESEQLVLMLGMRGNMPPACFERGFPELLLPPLSAPDASRLTRRAAAPATRPGPGAGTGPGGRQPDGADRAVPGSSRLTRSIVNYPVQARHQPDPLALDPQILAPAREPQRMPRSVSVQQSPEVRRDPP